MGKRQTKPLYVRSRKSGGKASPYLRRTITILLLLAVLAAIGFGLYKGFGAIHRKLFAENPAFDIQSLIISTDGKLTEQYIRESSGLSEGMNLFSFSLKDIEHSLCRISVVESVLLERKLPHTMIIRIKERVPVARILARDRSKSVYLVDRLGYVLPPRRSIAGLPLIMGLDADVHLGDHLAHPDIDIVLQILAICETTGDFDKYIRISSFDLKYQDYIDICMEDGTHVHMPRFALKSKLRKLAATIQTGQSRGERYREIDLTLDTPNVPVVVR